jgi:hypothetical protein
MSLGGDFVGRCVVSMSEIFKIFEILYLTTMYGFCIYGIYISVRYEIIAVKKNETSTDEAINKELRLINKILKEKRIKYEIIRCNQTSDIRG